MNDYRRRRTRIEDKKRRRNRKKKKKNGTYSCVSIIRYYKSIPGFSPIIHDYREAKYHITLGPKHIRNGSAR